MALALLGVIVDTVKFPNMVWWVTSLGICWRYRAGILENDRGYGKDEEWYRFIGIPTMQLREAIAWSLGWEAGVKEAGAAGQSPAKSGEDAT